MTGMVLDRSTNRCTSGMNPGYSPLPEEPRTRSRVHYTTRGSGHCPLSTRHPVRVSKGDENSRAKATRVAGSTPARWPIVVNLDRLTWTETIDALFRRQTCQPLFAGKRGARNMPYPTLWLTLLSLSIERYTINEYGPGFFAHTYCEVERYLGCVVRSDRKRRGMSLTHGCRRR
jgi:hypothetical protein